MRRRRHGDGRRRRVRVARDGGHERALLGAQLLLRELVHPAGSRLTEEVETRVRPVRHASVYTALDAVSASSLRRLLDIAAVLVPLMAVEAAASAGVTHREPIDWSHPLSITRDPPADREPDS